MFAHRSTGRFAFSIIRLAGVFACSVMLLLCPGFAQVGPAEIKDPHLKESEQAYLEQLTAANRAISALAFPFSFSLNRYQVPEY